jgi:hypothetical protein
MCILHLTVPTSLWHLPRVKVIDSLQGIRVAYITNHRTRERAIDLVVDRLVHLGASKFDGL